MMESHNFFHTKIMQYHHMMLYHKQKQLIMHNNHIGEFFQGGFFSLEVVTFFVTLRADLEDYFKCKT